MCQIRHAALAAIMLAIAGHADAGERIRYLMLVNRAYDSITRLELAPAGSHAFRETPFGAPLQGGGNSETIEIAGEGCLYDFRFGFRDGRTLIYKDTDICSGDKLVVRRLPPREAGRSAR